MFSTVSVKLKGNALDLFEEKNVTVNPLFPFCNDSETKTVTQTFIILYHGDTGTMIPHPSCYMMLLM